MCSCKGNPYRFSTTRGSQDTQSTDTHGDCLVNSKHSAMKPLTDDKVALSKEIKGLPSPKKRLASAVGSEKNTNNHHVVPLGILVVLCTVYLMVAGMQHNYRYYFKSGVAAYDLHHSQAGDVRPEAMAEFYVAAPDASCQKLDVFRKESDMNTASQPVSRRSQGKSTRRTKNGPGNGVSKQIRLTKSPEGHKKKEASKKSNTAEPIIYLFALVFIYLLLKAASDINQHYKSNKGDKRMRRCSLQSYAQIHKQDRRSSKVEESPIFPRKHIIIEERSVSVDRYKYTLNEEGSFTKSAPRVQEYHFRVVSPLASRPSHQHPLRLGGETRYEPHLNRRCSVPISINYQTVPVSSPYPPEMARRGSVISLTGPPEVSGAPSMPSGTADPKRRVRMINRH
ncbi:uncharacterized protein LOC122616020 isoform X2 [Drosophila teissieri]|uniref:uncharacterized protein LOC122616020 isoform X2 n=1 Tax=Drosophila teissieri TaxID=7243 RepID=UPI001CB9FE01|nr:uncharacterized protein LOC122616020 isoform X2 [Drosophila teissieri]